MFTSFEIGLLQTLYIITKIQVAIISCDFYNMMLFKLKQIHFKMFSSFENDLLKTF
jgi:hypothetical protein